MNISPLADAPECIPTLAGWFHQEWFEFDGRAMDAIQAQLSQNLKVGGVPITFIARSNSKLVGTVSIDLLDLPPFDHLSPWLASLYVVPEARRNGTGKALVLHAQAFAGNHGIGPLYLWTPGTTSLYEKCGWTTLRHTVYKSRPITLMQHMPINVLQYNAQVRG